MIAEVFKEARAAKCNVGAVMKLCGTTWRRKGRPVYEIMNIMVEWEGKVHSREKKGDVENATGY